MNNQGISAVLIVKNEEKVLGRCLRSLANLNEVVVLDTGSTDRTVDVARNGGASVYVAEPVSPFHFAQARNRALVHASHDWILSMDADEILRAGSIAKMRKAIEEGPDASAFKVTYINRAWDNATRTFSIRKTKLFRKDSWTWHRRVHEELRPVGSPLAPDNLEAVVVEHLPVEGKAGRHAQNIELMLLAIEEDPGHVRLHRHLGQEYMLQKRWTEAIPRLAHYAEKTEEGPLEKSEALTLIGRCYAESGQLDKALGWFDLAADQDPRRREPMFHAALELIRACRLHEAAGWAERMKTVPVGSRPGSHLDLPHVWADEPDRMIHFCRSEIEKAKAAALRK